MAKPTLYKKTSIQTYQERTRESLTVDEKANTKATVDKFFELFKLKHLS